MAATLGARVAPRNTVAERLQRRFGASWRSLLVLAAIAAFLLLLLIVPVALFSSPHSATAMAASRSATSRRSSRPA